jgi:hypothetical protein
MLPVHVVAITHTEKLLARTLAGLAYSSLKPASVTVSCDSDKPEIAVELERCARELGLRVTLVQRAFTGLARPAQTRNNGVRALLATKPDPASVLVLIDGDTCPAHRTLERYAELATRHDVLIGGRINLVEGQNERWSDEKLRAGQWPIEPSDEQIADVRSRQKRGERHLLLRRFGLVKGHKPKVISGNHAVRLETYLKINGYNEEYQGWGVEDDDLARRAYASGARACVACESCIAFHQWHPTRAGRKWSEAGGAPTFARGGPVRCVHGVENPLAQGPVSVRVIG